MDLLPLTFPAIDPVLVEIGPISIRWYGLAYLVGIVAGWRYALYLARLYGGRPASTDIESLVLWITFGIILGGRFGYVLFYELDAYLQKPLSILVLWHGGMSFHGGLVGVTAAIIIFAWKNELPLLKIADIVAPTVPIGLFFGRLANFINGELWGRVTDAPWAMVYPGAGDLPRHPSQLYEASLEGLVLFVVLVVLVHRQSIRKRLGLITGVFLLGYGLSRITVELFREPDAFLGSLPAGLTMGQILSLPMVAVGIALILRAILAPGDGYRLPTP